MGNAIYTKAEREQMERASKPVHPAAARFPMMPEERLAELVESIRAHGQRDPIVLLDGAILDGRNRQRACELAGIAPRYVDFADLDVRDRNPFAFVWDKNGQRRDLEASQREAIGILLERDGAEWTQAAKQRELGRKRSAAALARPRRDNGTLAATIPSRGGAVDSKHPETHGDEDRDVKPSNRTRERMHAVERHSPELLEKVARGEVKGMQALREIKREQLPAKLAALPAGTFRVIYADPPWKYGDDRAGIDRADSAAAAQYPLMSTDAICNLEIEVAGQGDRRVEHVADKDAVLFMWATFPLLEDAMRVITAWGFKYKTAIVWHKQRSNVGNYHDASCELLMICVRGSCPIEIDERVCQMQSIARGRHSAKPEEFRAIVDKLYPSGPRVELFRRGEAPRGWTIWGNEAQS